MSYFTRSDELSEWAAQIPESWGSNWLKWSVDLSTKRPNEEEQETLPYISNEDIASWTGKLLLEEPEPAEADSRTFRENDVLFNKLRPYLAKVYHATFKGVSSGELLCLQPSHTVEPRFLFYVLLSKSFIDTINAETFGAKMPRADWEIVGHQPLPLPPLDTQRRIARFLDEKTARIDGLIEKKRELLGRLSEKRQALITRAVTRGVDTQAQMRDCRAAEGAGGVNLLDQIPDNWTKASVGNFCDVQLGKMLQNDPSSDRDELKPYLRAVNIGKGGLNLGHEFSMWIRPQETDRFRLAKGDVLVSEGGDAGRAAIFDADGEYYFQNAINRVRPNYHGKIESDFIYYWFTFLKAAGYVDMICNVATIPHFTAEKVKAAPLALPPLETQRRIARFLDEKTAQIDRLIERIWDSVTRLEEYRMAQITAAVTGQIAKLQ